jgi:hypothetical protein
MAPRPVSTVPGQQQSVYDDLRLYNFDQMDVDLLSLTHRVATQIERKSCDRKAPVQRQGQKPIVKPTAALWCKACRTKGHSSPAFSESCNIRRLRKERKAQRTPSCEKLPRAKSKSCLKSGRMGLALSASDDHVSRSAQDSAPSRKSCDEEAKPATCLQMCSKVETIPPCICSPFAQIHQHGWREHALVTQP